MSEIKITREDGDTGGRHGAALDGLGVAMTNGRADPVTAIPPRPLAKTPRMAGRGVMTDTDITHDIAAGRYSLTIEGVEAHLDYQRKADGTVHITHTLVPKVLGGRGLGKRLVTRAVEDAIAKGLPIASSCWFATELIEKTPPWKAALAT